MAGVSVARPEKPVAESSDYLRLVAAKKEKDDLKASQVLQEIEDRRNTNV